MATRYEEMRLPEIDYGYVDKGLHRMKDYAQSHPVSSVLAAFGIGFGLGTLLAVSIAPALRSDSPGFDRRTAEKYGHQFRDSLASILPEQIAQRIRS